jgi:hypothetical protein
MLLQGKGQIAHCKVGPLKVLTVRAMDDACARPVIYGLLDKLTYVTINSSTGSIVVWRSFIDEGQTSPRKQEHVFRLSVDGQTPGGLHRLKKLIRIFFFVFFTDHFLAGVLLVSSRCDDRLLEHLELNRILCR